MKPLPPSSPSTEFLRSQVLAGGNCQHSSSRLFRLLAPVPKFAMDPVQVRWYSSMSLIKLPRIEFSRGAIVIGVSSEVGGASCFFLSRLFTLSAGCTGPLSQSERKILALKRNAGTGMLNYAKERKRRGKKSERKVTLLRSTEAGLFC